MLRKAISYLSIILLIFIFSSYKSRNEDNFNKKKEYKLRIIAQSLKSGHYNPRSINDEFSGEVFKNFLDRLDGSKRFFYKEDYEKLKKHKTRIDDQINTFKTSFFDEAISIYKKRLKEASGYYKSILKQPFDFDKEEYVQKEAKDRGYPSDKEEMKQVWKRYLKYQTLTKVHVALDRKEKAEKNNDTSYKEKSFEEIRKKARKEVRKSQKEMFNRLEKLNENDWYSEYLNVIASNFDPHTGYFPPKDKENFDIQLSGTLEGIGAVLTMKKGEVEVRRIVPGSASWRQGDLQAGDVILKVAQKNEDPVDVTNMRLDNVVQLIRGKKGTDVILTVRKVDGSIEEITITRDVVVIEETYAKSAIIKKEKKNEKVGYIKLPKFYADFNKEKGGRSCAEDVKKEITKLKNDGAKSIILDLRDNGGGSLRDVIDMAGLFIKNGPIVQVKPRNGPPRILRDKDTSVHFSGPLVVMVNSFSASASEIMAAAMQDYERGLVVGTGSTFGKGTVQRFVNLDKMLKEGIKALEKIKPLGSLKLTTQKFYRVNGGSTQLKGVSPDILIPDQYTYINYGEEKRGNALPWDEINSTDYHKTNMINNNSFLKTKTKQRIQTNKDFNLIEDYAKMLKKQNERSKYPLKLNSFRAQKHRIEEKKQEYKKIFKPIESFKVKATSDKRNSMESDSTEKARFEQFHKKVKEDLHLYFTLKTVYDWLENPDLVARENDPKSD